MTIVIGLMGSAGVGKSTAAAHLIERYGAKRYSLAAPLKEIARRTLEFTDEQLYGTQAQKEAIDPRYGFSPRWFLQKLGTDGCRSVFGENVWVRACLGHIVREDPRFAVIDDVRFLNEVREISAFGGYIWKLLPPADDIPVVYSTGAHASESDWRIAKVDHEIAPKKRGISVLQGLVDEAMKGVVS